MAEKVAIEDSVICGDVACSILVTGDDSAGRSGGR